MISRRTEGDDDRERRARQFEEMLDRFAADSRDPTPLTGLSMAATSRSAVPIGKNRKIARDESASAQGAPSANTTKPSRCRRREASSAASVEAGREKLAIRTGSHDDLRHYTALQRATLWEFGNSVVAIWIRFGKESKARSQFERFSGQWRLPRAGRERAKKDATQVVAPRHLGSRTAASGYFAIALSITTSV